MRDTMLLLLLLRVVLLGSLIINNNGSSSFIIKAQASSPTQRIASPSSSPPPQKITTNHSQTASLLKLRSDLGIRSRYWPRGSDPCLSWKGIQCENGHLTAIVLSGLRRTVTGALHPAFSLDTLQTFPFLRSLNASGFPLPGEIPDWFGRLANLQVLDFTSASLNNSIPSSLGGLSNLRVFILAHNNLTGDIPSSLGELSNLTVLDLSSNALTGRIPENVAKLQNLQMLNLSANHLKGDIPAGLGGFIQLQGLELAYNMLEGSIPLQLGNLSSLSSLNLGSNALSGFIPPELGNLTALNTLILSYNSLSGPIPVQMTHCTELQVLLLDQNSLTGQLPSLIGSLKKLSTLNLSYNSLTGVLPAGMSSLSQAKAILLSHNSFYGPLPAGITNLADILQLDFSYNYFSGTWSGPLLPGVVLQSNCFSEEGNQRSFNTCMDFYSKRGLPFQGTIASPHSSNQQPAAENTTKKSKPLGAMLGGVFGGLGLVFIIMLLVFFVMKQERKLESGGREPVTSMRNCGTESLAGVNLFCLGEKFSYLQLKQATGEFNPSNLLKAGHSGDFYKGQLEGGVPVVVKRIDISRIKKEAFLAELELFGKASHTRLVPLLGHCLELEEEKILVYKYMPNGDLAHALHRKTSGSFPEETLQSLDWITRLKIAIGAAEGLMYLHHECSPPIVHRDIQASSILLEDKFEVRLGSLTEACIAEGESHHGVIARLFRISQTPDQGERGAPVPTCAYDVYCFGKVLLELVTGKIGMSSPIDTAADAWLEWALPLINIYDKESMAKLVDSSLILDEDLLEEVWAMAIVAKSCLNPKPSKRPLMRYILKALENPLKVVREDALNGSGRSRTSSHGSWNGAFFGSWRHSSSETVVIPGSLREEHLNKSSSKQLGNGGSQGSVQGEVSHRRPGSNEIFPEPVEDSLVQAANTES